MTGGWYPYKDEEDDWVPRAPAALSASEQLVDERFAEWVGAVKFRRFVRGLMKPHGLTFTDWVVLHAAARELRAQGDAVSQQAIAKRAAIDEGTASVCLGRLMHHGYADIGPDARCWSYRVLLTKKARALLGAIVEQLVERGAARDL